MQKREHELRELAAQHGQEHLFAFWDELSSSEQRTLLDQIASIDFVLIKELWMKENHPQTADFSPPPIMSKAGLRAKRRGAQALRNGKLALLLAAGGEATRLGFGGPKVTFPITPITNRTILDCYFTKFRTARKIYGQTFDVYIMVSLLNINVIRRYLEENDYFGYPKEHVILFVQEYFPVVDDEGKILLASKKDIALKATGTGAIYHALREAGLFARMKEKGITMLSYMQVDNPLVNPLDEGFIGIHLETGAEVTCKVVEKTRPEEAVGVFVKEGDHTSLVEYIHLPSTLAVMRDENDKLTYRAANIAVHIMNVSFVERTSRRKLPMHKAKKRIPFVDGSGRLISPETPNAIKFEAFIFDAFLHAKKVSLLEVKREEEFAPVKNKDGNDSPATARALMNAKAKRWLLAAGIPDDVVDRLDDVEINEELGLSQESFVINIASRIGHLQEQFKLSRRVYLSR